MLAENQKLGPHSRDTYRVPCNFCTDCERKGCESFNTCYLHQGRQGINRLKKGGMGDPTNKQRLFDETI